MSTAPAISRMAKITAYHGLHMRPAMEFTLLCRSHSGNIAIRKFGLGNSSASADAKSIVEVLLLCVGPNETVVLESDSETAAPVLDKACRFLENIP
ncbi:MAG: HPr family phosphocarrier protein [Planctomycetota bacterium]|jgi:phosphotransferase system HPr (HPr) family protein|nr:HPr family phosphocarrier protein [Planctomycetota bacterium]